MATPTWTERIRKYVIEEFTDVAYSSGGVGLASKTLSVVEEASILEIETGGGTIAVGYVKNTGISATLAGTIPNGIDVVVYRSVGTLGVSEYPDGGTISSMKLLLGGS